MVDTISILDGNHFVVSNRLGDLEATPTVNHGFFLNDTRYLSRWVLTINGMRPTLLSVDDTAYDQVQHFLALATGAVYIDSRLTVIRQREIGDGFVEKISLANHGREPVDITIRLEAGADFADLFEVKDMREKKGELYRKVEGSDLVLGYRRGAFHRETRVTSSAPADVDENGLSFAVRLAPRSDWSTALTVIPVREPAAAREAAIRASAESPEHAETLSQWLGEAPRVFSSWEPLQRIYRRSLVDLAALRFRAPVILKAMPAAGLPWFMTIFGRAA